MLDRGDGFEALYEAQHDRLVRAAALMTGSTAAAEDMVQEAFAKLHLRWGRVDEPAAWLRTVVMNSAKNELRRSSVRRRFLERNGPRAVTAHLDQPVNEIVHSLRRLPARQRAVVVLRYYEDLPEAEIAELLGIRLGTVKSSLHRALEALRNEVQR